MGKFSFFGVAFVIAYWASYLALRRHTSRVRHQRPSEALPPDFSLFLGTAALGYLWSDRHRQANDQKLSQLVFATLTTQLLLPFGLFIFMSG